MLARPRKRIRYVVCVENDGYPASLELWKLYEVVADRKSESYGFLRVIDESGEDYLFPAECFQKVAVPDAVRRAMLAKSA